ncbi:MAG TPA: hypothetical protein VLU94_01590, partial [Candidatus Nitrosotalea sp.]|nr:hypothetical protein [Candidatus Nitrosotalea sp.]
MTNGSNRFRFRNCMNWRFNSRRPLAVAAILCGFIGVESVGANQPASGPAMRRDGAAADCNDAGVSADGRFVVFVSNADNLVAGDHNGLSDVFVRDRTLGRTTLVSVNSSGTASGNGASRAGTISADGRFVAFESLASDLVANDTNGVSDIFLRDLVAGTTMLVSVSGDGITPGNGPSSWPVMTPDGHFVLFESRASNLDTNDANNAADLFVRDMSSGITTLVTRDRFSNASALGGDFFFSDAARISDDGRWVAFASAATNLVAFDNNSKRDVFLRDLLNRTNILVSVNTNKVAASGISGIPALSADGRFVAFQSLASDLAAKDNNATNDVFLRDVALGTTTLVSVSLTGASGKGSSFGPVISADGRYVGFQSLASDLVANDSSSDPNIQPLDVFVRDLQTGVTTMISEHSTQTILDASYYTNWTGPGGEARAL